MHRTLQLFVAAAVALICTAQTPIRLQPPPPTLTVKNLAPNRWAAVTVFTAMATRWHGPSQFSKRLTFCLKNGESKTMTFNPRVDDYYRVRADLRKLADCATPNVIETLETPAFGSRILLTFTKSESHREVLIEGNNVYKIRVIGPTL